MELRHLRYFVAVAEELNFRRAAERLYVAQPAVSEQVRKLEDELGVRLLERSQRKVSLTEAGTALLPEARRVLHEVEMARVIVQNARDRAVSQLRIGYTPASLPARIPRALRRLSAELANAVTSLEPRDGAELIDAVRAERLDAAVVPLPAPTGGLRVTQIGEEGAVAAFPIDHRHAVSAAIRLDQIAPEQIVVLPREVNRPFHDALVAACRDAGVTPTFIEIPDKDVESVLLAVAAGAGMAVLPGSVAERYLAPGVRFVALDGLQRLVTVGVVTRRDSTHLPTAAFLRAVSRTDKPCERVETPIPTAA
jgi:DNA-binding transcriptional LysR family regulator